MSWRWRLAVAGVVTVLLAMAATFVLPLLDTQAEGPVAAAPGGAAAPAEAPAPSATAPPAADPAATSPLPAVPVPPEPVAAAPAPEPVAAAPAGSPEAPAGGALEVRGGAVGVSEVFLTAPAPGIAVVAYRLDRPAAVAVTLVGTGGRRVASVSRRRVAAGGQSEILSLPPRSAVARVLVVAARPGSAPGAPTVATLSLAAVRPSLEVVPADGAVVRGRRVTVRLRPRGFAIAGQGTAPQPGRGHFHLTLDDRAYIVVYGTRFTFTDVAPGPHTLVVAPALDDHRPAPAPAERVVRFTTVAP